MDVSNALSDVLHLEDLVKLVPRDTKKVLFGELINFLVSSCLLYEFVINIAPLNSLLSWSNRLYKK